MWATGHRSPQTQTCLRAMFRKGPWHPNRALTQTARRASGYVFEYTAGGATGQFLKARTAGWTATGVSGATSVVFAELREQKGSKRKSKERGVYAGYKRLGALERGIMRPPSKNAGNASVTELLIHLRNISAHFQLLLFQFAERYRAISRTPLDSDKAV